MLQITITLEGTYAALFERVLALANRAPGPPLGPDGLAESLIKALLDDDAANVHEDERLN